MSRRIDRGDTITLLVAHAGTRVIADPMTFVTDADEVIEVTGGDGPQLQDAVSPAVRYRALAIREGGLAHALNLGASFASSDWIVITYGDEAVSAGWIDHVRSLVSGPESPCIHVFHPQATGSVPVVAARRSAFVYGQFDERFASGRLAAVHWVYRVFPRPTHRMLPHEGVRDHCCDFVDRTPAISGEERDALAAILSAKAPATAVAPNPYRSSNSYEPRQFWEANTVGYIRWEIYQPDEPELLAMLSRLTYRAVLELGCGAGRNTRYFADAGRYAGVDLSMNLLRRATERQEPNSLGIVCGDITALPYADASVDLVFADSTVQHVRPAQIEDCIAEIVRVSSDYIGLIEYTEEDPGGDWFAQIHMFAHDYRELLAPYCDLVWHADTSLKVHPARKEAFLFRKRRSQ